jgi:chromosome segregation ATPase
MVNNEELKVDVNKCKDDVDDVKYRLKNVEKMQKDMNEKIDKLLETERTIDRLIQQGERLLAFSENDKTNTKRRLNEHCEKIEQLMERVEALFIQLLAYRRPPLSLEIPEINP